MKQIILASCENPPVEPDDDPRLAAALKKAGHEATILPWTDITPGSLPSSGTVVLRSTWDYHHSPEHFLAWIDALEAAGILVLNPSSLIRLSIDKSYLAQHRPFGCAAPVTIDLPAEEEAVAGAARDHGWRHFILKPPVSASADGTFLLDADDRHSLRAALAEQPPRILVQEFLPEIRQGELSLIFFGGWFSHAVRKIPATDDYRVQAEFGSRIERIRPAVPVIAAARRAVMSLPEIPCYARVDGVMRRGEFLLMELELIEPELFLRHMPRSAEIFADTVLRMSAR